MRTRTFGALLLSALAAAASLAPASLLAAPIADKAASIPQRVIVRVEPGKLRVAEDGARAAGAKLHGQSKTGNFFVVSVPAGVSAEAVAGRLDDGVGVRYAHVAHMVRAAYVPNDTYYSKQWDLPLVGMPEAWDVTRGAGVTIAIVDTGIDLSHPDLAANVDTVNDYDFYNLDSTAQDDGGHGTHVAGIAAAVTGNSRGVAGIANKAKLLPIKVLNYKGGGWDSDVALGIRWAADKGADVINLSLGGPAADSVLNEAVDYARAAGCIVVAAAGNYGTSAPFYPAAVPGVIGVAATDVNDQRAVYSSFGSDVDISAPGDEILSTWLGGGTFTDSGTSMASPVVSGVAALLLAQNPGWTESQVMSRIDATALDLGAPGRDDYFGAGRIDAGFALFADTANDEVPGVALPESPFSGRVSATLDGHDVYEVRVKPGATLELSLAKTGSAPGEVDLRLLGPGTTSLASANVIWSDSGAAYPKAFSYTPDSSQDATYFIDVAAASRTGNYTLTWRNDLTVVSTIAASATSANWQSSVELSGTVTRPNGLPLSGVELNIEARPTGGAWTSIGHAATGALGDFATTAEVTRTTEYRVSVPTQQIAAADVSPLVTVTCRPRLTRPSHPSRPRAKIAFTSVAYLAPAHAAGRRDVKFTAYRYEYGVWRARRTVYAVSGTTTGGITRYSARVSLQYRGTWKMVARVSADGAHAAASASTSKFGVR